MQEKCHLCICDAFPTGHIFVVPSSSARRVKSTLLSHCSNQRRWFILVRSIKFLECRELNRGQLGEKRQFYLCPRSADRLKSWIELAGNLKQRRNLCLLMIGPFSSRASESCSSLAARGSETSTWTTSSPSTSTPTKSKSSPPELVRVRVRKRFLELVK